MQINMALAKEIRQLFAKSHATIDFADLDVKSKDTVDIEKRIDNFRQRVPGYHISIESLITEKKPGACLVLCTHRNKKLFLYTMVLFSLDGK